MEKVLKILLAIISISVISTATISILNFMNVDQDKYLMYILWLNALLIFYMILPSSVSFDKL